MVGTLDALALAAAPGSLAEARHKRDALLIAMLLANPMRSRQFSTMRWRPGGGGNLYRTDDGGWRLRYEARHRKNGRKAYDAPLPAWLGDRIDAYLEEYRPRLLAGRVDGGWVFPSTRGGGVWAGLGRHVEKLTRRHLPNCPGFGPHAFRHLVATSWLRRHPNDYLTVAELLDDTLQVVIQNYAHLRKDDSFGRYEQYIDGIR
jgi:integrase